MCALISCKSPQNPPLYIKTFSMNILFYCCKPHIRYNKFIWDHTQQPATLHRWTHSLLNSPTIRLHSHKHEYESGTVWVPVYEFRQTRVCVYFSGGRSHTYEYRLLVNFTRTSIFCAGHVFIQPLQSKLPVNNNNIMYKSCGIYFSSELTSL